MKKKVKEEKNRERIKDEDEVKWIKVIRNILKYWKQD